MPFRHYGPPARRDRQPEYCRPARFNHVRRRLADPPFCVKLALLWS